MKAPIGAKKGLGLLAPALLVAVASAVACTGRRLDLGGNYLETPDSGGGSAPGEDAGLDTTIDSTDQGGTADAGADQAEGDDEVWSGYIENYSFPSGSDSLVLTFTRQSDGGITGHAIFGDAPFYAPATDPDEGYPDTSLDAGSLPGSLEGFRYPLLDAAIDGLRLRATVDPGELYAGWCALQTPYPHGVVSDGESSSLYTCMPPATVDNASPPDSGLPDGCYVLSDGGAATVVSCLRLWLCGMADVCDCTSASCTYLLSSPGGQATLDLQIDGNQATGSVRLPYGTSHNTYLTSP